MGGRDVGGDTEGERGGVGVGRRGEEERGVGEVGEDGGGGAVVRQVAGCLWKRREGWVGGWMDGKGRGKRWGWEGRRRTREEGETVEEGVDFGGGLVDG